MIFKQDITKFLESSTILRDLHTKISDIEVDIAQISNRCKLFREVMYKTMIQGTSNLASYQKKYRKSKYIKGSYTK